jgi:SAM-dependent methyltransferase
MTGAGESLEHSSCPLGCGAPVRSAGHRNEYRLLRCGRCAHLFTANPPSAEVLDQHYSRYSYDKHGLDTVPPFVFDRLAQILAPFEQYRQNNRLLDVGFGAGALLRVAQKCGWDVFGIERSPLAVEQARANGFKNVQVADIADAPFPDGYFDVVVMFELIEHLIDALPFLRHGRRLLRGGGLLYVTTPNGSGISGRLLSARWSVAAPPEHLQLFSPRSLRQALASAGFDRVAIRTEGVNPFELARHLGQRVRPGTPPSKPAASTSSVALNERLSGSAWGSLAKEGVNGVLRLLSLGDAMKASAVKPG